MNNKKLLNAYSLNPIHRLPSKEDILETSQIGIHILPDWQYNLFYNRKTRAICKEKSGEIYIKRSAYCEHVLVHELIHRLSRNQKKGFGGRKIWQNGIATIENGVNYTGLNEIITEWFTVRLVGSEENNIYESYFPFFEDIFSCQEEALVQAFFQSNAQSVYDLIYVGCQKQYSYEQLKNMLNSISEKIIHREFNNKVNFY